MGRDAVDSVADWPLCSHSYCVLGPRHREAVEDLVRREVERCDRLSGLMAVMSVAGGTGSGVGTYLTQRLRDAYPTSFILNHLTWPYGSGEVRGRPVLLLLFQPLDCSNAWFFFFCLPGDSAELQLGADAGPPLPAV